MGISKWGISLWLTAILVAAAAEQSNDDLPPSNLRLRAGILHAPPFAIRDVLYDGAIRFRGFQIDLLDRLSQFALEDNVTLTFEMSTAPSQYDDAFNTVAKDCEQLLGAGNETCSQFDLIVGDFYVNPSRSLRVDFTPSWLRTTMSTVRLKPEDHDNNLLRRDRQEDFMTLKQAETAYETVCVPAGTYIMEVVMGKFPHADYYKCFSPEDCLRALQDKICVLYADDELLLRHRASLDDRLEVTREQLNTQYLVWPMRRDLSPIVSDYIKRWMYAAVANATLDELYFKYFQKELCPVGTAGENCELPCDPEYGEADTEGQCICKSTRWTGDDCSIEVEEDANLIPSPLKVLAFNLMGINYLMILGCAAWLIWRRESNQVKVSQPFFLGLVLLGCSISTSTIIAMAQEDDGDGPVKACMAIPWLYSLGFSITFGTLFAKIRRVYRIFQYRAKSGVTTSRSNARFGRGVFFSSEFLDTVGMILLVLLINCLIMVWWTIMSPLEWERTVTRSDIYGEPLESYGICTSDNWKAFAVIMLVFHLALLSYGCYLCYVTRHIPTRFQEGRALSIAMGGNLQIVLVGVPLLFVMQSSPASTFLLRSIIIWINNLVIVSMIFGNLIYYVHFRIELEEPEDFKATIGQAVQDYTNNSQRLKAMRTSPKGSQFSNSSRTPPTAKILAQESIMSEEENTDFDIDELQSTATPKSHEIVLTKSELERNDAGVRRGEFYRKREDSVVSLSKASQSRPLARSMLDISSVSTVIHENRATMVPYPVRSDIEPNPLSQTNSSGLPTTSSLPFSSTASVCSVPGKKFNAVSNFSAASSLPFSSTASSTFEDTSPPNHTIRDPSETISPPQTTYNGRKSWSGGLTMSSIFPGNESARIALSVRSDPSRDSKDRRGSKKGRPRLIG